MKFLLPIFYLINELFVHQTISETVPSKVHVYSGLLMFGSIEKGAFNNYVDRILPVLAPPPPHLVHVVIEWPQRQIGWLYF